MNTTLTSSNGLVVDYGRLMLSLGFRPPAEASAGSRVLWGLAKGVAFCVCLLLCCSTVLDLPDAENLGRTAGQNSEVNKYWKFLKFLG